VKGFPILDYFPKDLSGKETPISETPILCSLTPDNIPTHPTKPIFIQVFPYLAYEG